MLLPPLCVLSAAVHVATAVHVAVAVCVAATGHADHCCMCHLWPCMSLLWAVCVTPEPTVQPCKRKKKLVKKRKRKNKDTSKSCFVVFVAITGGPKLSALKPQPEMPAPAWCFLGLGLSLWWAAIRAWLGLAQIGLAWPGSWL